MISRILPSALAGFLLTCGVAGCAGERPQEVFVNTVDGLARGACRAAGNCDVQCPNGEPARGRQSVCTK